ncbi:Ankyrin repeat protein [Rickettsiales bacterium Ac37b]|nr:Ankyrin repeat protein [Rickettsiales bacterium Ac37b]
MKDNNSLFQAFTNNNYPEIEKLLFSANAKELTNITFEDHANILHLAAEHGYDKLIPRIIELGIDKDSKNNNGETPLHYAAKEGKKKTIIKLLYEGANVNAEDHYRFTPLHYAVFRGKKENITILIENGADINIKTNNDITPLHYAAQAGNTEAINILIHKGTEVNSQTTTGEIPLHFAAETGEKEAIITLLNKGAIVDIRDNSNHTPIEVAQRNNYPDIATILIGELLITKLYHNKIDSEESYTEENVIQFLPRLEFLLKTKGLPSHLLIPNNIPEAIRLQIISFIEPFNNIEKNIHDAVEVHSAAILYKLYPEQFPSPLPYSHALKYKDYIINTKICNKLLESYEQNPQFKPVNFFNWIIGPANTNSVIEQLISCRKEVKNMFRSSDNIVLTQDQCKNLLSFKETFNSTETKAKFKNLPHMEPSNIITHPEKDLEHAIQKEPKTEQISETQTLSFQEKIALERISSEQPKMGTFILPRTNQNQR